MQDDATGASPPLNRGRAADLIGRSALSAHQKLILLAYMSHLPSDRPPDSGVAWPGLDTLSTWASCSRSTAQAARAELLTAGVLVAVERGDTSMKCRLDFGRLASWEPPARESRRGGAGVRQGADDRQGAEHRQGGVPNIGRGGAEHRQGGVPVFGTEPSSVIPPHQPSTDIPHQSMSGAAAPSPAGAGQLSLLSGQVEPSKPARPSRAAREVEAAEDLLRRLDAMRLDRHRGGRALSPTTWLPRVRRALARQSPQEVVDGWTWMLRSPEAAWLRAEDARRPGSDYTRDLSTLLAHPEYAERRSWRGLEGAHEHDLEPRGEAPAVQVVHAAVAAREREEREREERRPQPKKVITADDICF